MNTTPVARIVILALLLLVSSSPTVVGYDMERSFVDWDLHKVRFSYATTALGQAADSAGLVVEDDWSGSGVVKSGKKSPLKAFLLSMAVPGLGQYYYGSRIKPWLFFGAEVAAWGLHVKWHGDGEDATDVYEAYNRTHWSRSDYEQYLQWTYGFNDDSLVDATEISHHLPDEETQQYFEMTGKYDQFAWGWDDAVFHDSTLYDFDDINKPPRAVGGMIPYTANRLYYEGLRDDANRKFDRAQKMIMAAIVNRLISGFEAYFVTKHRNESSHGKGSALSRVKVSASLKSYHAKRDTPYLKLAYKF